MVIDQTFITSVRHLDQVDSTNSYAMSWSRTLSEQELPALVLAERQTAGRGRGTNSWWSSEGALTFSVMLMPERYQVRPEQWPALSLTVGASIALAIENVCRRNDLRVKWPNDVYLGERKLGGILIEVPQETRGSVVIGVGLNVRNSPADAPKDFRHRVASLAEGDKPPPSQTEVLIACLTELERGLSLLGQQHQSLTDQWRRLCLLTGRSVTVVQGGQEISGSCLGIDDDGALRIQTSSGTERLFSGVVSSF